MSNSQTIIPMSECVLWILATVLYAICTLQTLEIVYKYFHFTWRILFRSIQSQKPARSNSHSSYVSKRYEIIIDVSIKVQEVPTSNIIQHLTASNILFLSIFFFLPFLPPILHVVCNIVSSEQSVFSLNLHNYFSVISQFLPSYSRFT